MDRSRHSPRDGHLANAPDVDEARDFFRQKQSAQMKSKVTTVKDAVSEYIDDGNYIAVGGFGTNRIPTAVLHEIVRQRKTRLGLAGHTSTHDFQILASGSCVDRCDIAYVVGLEARGLSRIAREAFESGDIEATEWTNAALAWRYKAAAMGVSFLPIRTMLGSDTVHHSTVEEISCPFTGTTYLAVPALFPDVGIIHVHRSDIYGNCQVDGIMISDYDLARASRQLIITTEQIVSNEIIRRRPDQTIIPHYVVDAVIEVPYGSYPGNMPYLYYSDEDHLRKWLDAERDPDTFAHFLDTHIYSAADHWDYLDTVGGTKLLDELRKLEHPESWGVN